MLTLSGCGDRTPPEPAAKAETGADAGYATSPSLNSSAIESGVVVLRGLAAPDSAVRLASPAGEAFLESADSQGRWRMALPLSDEARIFGLSMSTTGRSVQAQGYVMVGPDGGGVVLRAGTGALRLDGQGAPRVTAFDFDREGGAAVSGRAPPNAAVSVRVDGRPAADGRADAAGRFNIALTQPVAAGRHTVTIAGERFTDAAMVELAPAPPLQGGPFRAAPTNVGLRVDWMTPGGGVQSTLLLN
jgi:hypothetical protein